jgi:hypothetical protein
VAVPQSSAKLKMHEWLGTYETIGDGLINLHTFPPKPITGLSLTYTNVQVHMPRETESRKLVAKRTRNYENDTKEGELRTGSDRY